jgi:pyrroline-5-carboxylate reductase
MKVLVLGAGKMTEAILSGLMQTESLQDWMIYSPSGTSATKLAEKVGARAVIDLSGIQHPDVILVGCKPQQLKDLGHSLSGRFRDSLYLSFCAAISEEDQKSLLGVSQLIRCMPNLPVEQREGVILLSSLSAKDRLSSFQELFSQLGTCLIVSEEELDELTLLTGSGSAFFYEFASTLASSFSSLHSLEREKLVRQVFQGAALMAQEKTQTLSELTEAVTSKGGVTIAVLERWRENKISLFIKDGILAGIRRAQELRVILRN